jgi:hypothetical protein
VNGIAGVLFLAAFVKRRDVVAMLWLGTASMIAFVISLIWLVLRLQKAFSLDVVSSETSRFLWRFQAIAEYISIILFLVGVIQLYRYFVAETVRER